MTVFLDNQINNVKCRLINEKHSSNWFEPYRILRINMCLLINLYSLRIYNLHHTLPFVFQNFNLFMTNKI